MNPDQRICVFCSHLLGKTSDSCPSCGESQTDITEFATQPPTILQTTKETHDNQVVDIKLRAPTEVVLFFLRVMPIIVGLFWGYCQGYSGRRLPTDFGFVALIALIAMIAGLVVSLKSPNDSQTILLGFLIFLTIAIVLSDPLMETWSNALLGRNICLILPHLVAIGYFARRRNVPATIGTMVFLGVSVAVLVFNTRYSDYWLGFVHFAFS